VARSNTAEVLAHPSRIPDKVVLKRVILNADFRCRDEGFTYMAIDRIAQSKDAKTGKSKGTKWATEWWARNIDGHPGHFVLFVNRAQTLMALVGHGFYAQARFERRVDLGALKTAFLEAWGIELTVSQTLEDKYAKTRKLAFQTDEAWWDI
jgi:hypothetical protein